MPQQWFRSRAAIRVELLAGLAVAVLLGLWLLVKVRLFLGLEYTSDAFLLVQLTSSWLQGRPLLWENAFGAQSAAHAYWLAPLLGPLTRAWGVYGLFGAHALLLALASHRMRQALSRVEPWRGTVASTTFLLGPVGFWLWDDPIYGWHLELLYVPLAVLFAAALGRRSRAAWGWAFCLATLREDGAVVACAVHLLFVWQEARDPFRSRRHLLRSTRIAAAWLAGFIVGLVLLRAGQPASGGRLSAALSSLGALGAHPDAATEMATAALGALLLICAGSLVTPRRSWTRLIVSALPVLGVALVGSAVYVGGPGLAIHGLLWPVRFSMLWGVTGAAVILAPSEPSSHGEVVAGWSRPWPRIGLCLALQVILLVSFRSYDPTARLVAGLQGGKALNAGKLSARDRDALECLALALPRDTPVAAHGSLFAYFHRHDLVWPGFAARAWTAPRVVACEVGDILPYEAGCAALQAQHMTGGRSVAAVGRLVVSYEPSLGDLVGPCFASRPPPR